MAYGSITAREQQAKFDLDLNDTLGEFELVMSRFEKYGDPKAKPAAATNGAQAVPAVAAKSEPLTAPEKVTISWLLANVPVTWYLALVVSYVAAFGAGMTVASTKLGKTIVEWVTPAPSASKPAGTQ